MRGKCAVLTLAACVVSLLAFAATASADAVICTEGEGKGDCGRPDGVAVDFETGRLYVADKGNDRIDVFGPTGAFEKAFGWGIIDGASELQVCTTSCQAGTSGSGSGQLNGPTSIAVDNDPSSPSHGDLYVVDYNNLRVQKFDPTAGPDEEGVEFLLAFGGGVNKTTSGDICTAASGNTCGAGSDGFSEGELSANTSIAGSPIFVGVGPAGIVYVVDSLKPSSTEVSQWKYRLQRFEPPGGVLSPQYVLAEGTAAAAFTVDSSGSFYVSDGKVRKFELGGIGPVEVDQIAETRVFAMAVDPDDNLFFSANEDPPGNPGVRQSVAEYDASGAPLRRFGYGSFNSVVTGVSPYLFPPNSATGAYVSEEGNFNNAGKVQHIQFPDPGPIVLPEPCKVTTGTLGNTRATLQAQINPEGKATTFHFEYFSGSNPPTSTPEVPVVLKDPGDPGEVIRLQEATVQLEGLAPETEYHCRAVAKNADGEAEGEEGSFETKEQFEFGPAWVEAVDETAAILNAEGNALGIPAKVFFQYVDDAKYQVSGFTEAAETTVVDIGEGEDFVTATAGLADLAPGTLYHYRLVASNAFSSELVDPENPEGGTFRTYSPEAAGPPDGRGYELVSPGKKNSAEVGVPSQAGGLAFFNYRRIQASDSSGEAITYTSWTSFGEAEGAPGASQYISRRTPSGWGTENSSPFGVAFQPLAPTFRSFSPELEFAGVMVSQPALTEECPDGSQNFYLRDNTSGELHCLTPEVPVIPTGLEGLCFDYAGASADGSRAFFATNISYAGAPTSKGFSLYEWSQAEGLRVVSVLPNGTVAKPSAFTAFGRSGFNEAGVHCQTGETVTKNVVSADGRRVFWTYAPESGGASQSAGADRRQRNGATGQTRRGAG